MRKIMLVGLSLALLGAGCQPLTQPMGEQPQTVQTEEATSTAPTPAPTTKAPTAPAKPKVTNGTTSLSIISYQYSPATLKVKRGTKIIVTNKDGVAHTVTSKQGSFDSGELNFNESVTIDTMALSPGSYPYYCIYHPEMKGTIVVE